MQPIHIPEDWNDNGLITFEQFCDAHPHTPAHRPRLAPTRHRTPLGPVRRLRAAVHVGRRGPSLRQRRRRRLRP